MRVSIPLAIAISLAVTFIVLLVSQARRSQETARELSAQKDYSLTQISPSELPQGSPTDPRPPPRKRYEGKYPRWNLTEFPEGWNPALARQIHDFFEKMTVDFQSEEQLVALRPTREAFREFLAGLGPEAIPTLGAILNAEGDFVHRRFVLVALGNLGPRSDAATYVLRDFFMARYTDRRNDSEIWHVIKAMGHLQNDSSLGVLSDLAQNPDPGVERHRDHYIEALGEHPRRGDAVEVFVDHLHVDREVSKPVRNKAAQALGKVRDPKTLSELYRAAEYETHWALKQTMFGSIGKIGEPSSVEFLENQYRKALDEPETQDENLKRVPVRIRLGAARAISRIATPHALDVLHEIKQIEPDEKTRSYIEKWIEESQNPQPGI